MMRAQLGHVGINLSGSDESFALWKDMLTFLGFEVREDGNHFDAFDQHSYICVTTTKPEHRVAGYHRRHTGLSHLAFRVADRVDVDRFVEQFLVPRSIQPLYGGAREYPEYVDGYYAVYFEDPDRVKVEITFDPSLPGPGLR